jgi:hypothetical protein
MEFVDGSQALLDIFHFPCRGSQMRAGPPALRRGTNTIPTCSPRAATFLMELGHRAVNQGNCR